MQSANRTTAGKAAVAKVADKSAAPGWAGGAAAAGQPQRQQHPQHQQQQQQRQPLQASGTRPLASSRGSQTSLASLGGSGNSDDGGVASAVAASEPGGWPAVSVVLPVKGRRPHSEAAWASQLAIDYGEQHHAICERCCHESWDEDWDSKFADTKQNALWPHYAASVSASYISAARHASPLRLPAGTNISPIAASCRRAAGVPVCGGRCKGRRVPAAARSVCRAQGRQCAPADRAACGCHQPEDSEVGSQCLDVASRSRAAKQPHGSGILWVQAAVAGRGMVGHRVMSSGRSVNTCQHNDVACRQPKVEHDDSWPCC